MAELTTDPTPTSSCCSPAAQETCCEPSEKGACCGTAAAGGNCGCSAGTSAAEPDIRETVRERYAASARAAAEPSESSCGCGPVALIDERGEFVFGGSLYTPDETGGATATAVEASLGCGVPTAVADPHEGETVLDLGSGAGAGADVLISAGRVGASGKAIGLDMTDEMLDLARKNASDAGVANVEFVKGYIDGIPLADASVDVVISNCVINLAGDKHKVIAETARVLRPGGRFAVSDVIADPGMDEATRADMAQWTGCIAGALPREEFEQTLADAGMVDVDLRESHRVHEHAASAIIRARKPGA
jgi:SAM-dependent methyltransferase